MSNPDDINDDDGRIDDYNDDDRRGGKPVWQKVLIIIAIVFLIGFLISFPFFVTE
jgi:hypothetical protein